LNRPAAHREQPTTHGAGAAAGPAAGRSFREIVEARRASATSGRENLLARACPQLAERWLDLEGFAQPAPPLRLEERLHA